MNVRPAPRGLAGALLALAAAGALAQGASAPPPARKVGFAGAMGERAVLVIDGQLRTLSPGATERGVKLLAVREGEAQVEIDGRPALLRLGASPGTLAGAARAPEGRQIVLAAGPGGHFTAQGQINGKPVLFLVDTGATAVALSQADAERIGLPLRNARRAMAQTANGTLAVSFVMLSSVRIGDVEVHNVEAAVVPAPMSHVLLGNSFLTRFQMKRENDVLTLEKRPY